MSKLHILEYASRQFNMVSFEGMRLLILRGQPGSGKSTWAENFIRKQKEHHGKDWELVEADQFFMKNGEYCFNKDLLPQAHAWCLGQVRTLLAAGKNVIVANTNTKLYMMRPYLESAKDNEAPFAIFRIFGFFRCTKSAIALQTIIRHIRDYEDFTWQKYEEQVLNPIPASPERINKLLEQRTQPLNPHNVEAAFNEIKQRNNNVQDPFVSSEPQPSFPQVESANEPVAASDSES